MLSEQKAMKDPVSVGYFVRDDAERHAGSSPYQPLNPMPSLPAKPGSLAG